MKKQTYFKPYEPNQLLLLPPDMRCWLPADDLVYFLMDVVRELDLSAVYSSYDGSHGGQPPYDPRMMSYGRMEKKAEELEAEVKRLLEEAEAIDAAEDALYGKGRRGDELPEELRSRQSRLKKIKEAMASLEAEAKEQADTKRQAIIAKEETLEKEGRKRKGKKPKEPSGRPRKSAAFGVFHCGVL